MKPYSSQIKDLKRINGFLEGEVFVSAKSGTNYKVFLSKNYVIRFRNDNKLILFREAKLLKKIKHHLIPHILWFGENKSSVAMVQNRLNGEDLDKIWKTISKRNKLNIVLQVVDFLKWLRKIKSSFIYLVRTGKKYTSFNIFLNELIDEKSRRIKKNKNARVFLDEILTFIQPTHIDRLFYKTKKTLVHGDLIIHNILSDGKKLTGVLDWEFAMFGDPDYDICRLFYYRECARAYYEKGKDNTFEKDYLDSLIGAIQKSSLIKNKKQFKQKYVSMRAVFYLSALHWAVCSKDKKKNIREVETLWNNNKKHQT